MMIKTLKKSIALILSIIMLVSMLPANAFASEDEEYSITNGFLTYTFNPKTGGFAFDTDMGHPQKMLDDNIPLLYKEDKDRSNGTSFVSVRIDDKDYIFGQDYKKWFKLESELKEPVITEEGRLITIEWSVDGVTVIKRIALGTDMDSDLTGNAGISFEVINNKDTAVNVGIRLLLDTALGYEIDAPYIIVDESVSPTYVETEYTGEELPGQIRNVDALVNPSVMSYLITKGWEGGKEPDKVIVGHWANIANTKYEYTADKYCDFTNYSNLHSVPDSAAAIYWEQDNLAPNASFKGESLYGIGNFSSDVDESNVGLNVAVGRVELTTDKTAYKNDGIVEVTVEIDNTLDKSVTLTDVVLNINFENDDFEAITSTQAAYTMVEKEIKTTVFKLKAKPQDQITAGEIYIALAASELTEDGTFKATETMAQRNVILPSVKGNKAKIQLNQINPKTVYTLYEKAITISGEMKEFDVLKANQGWNLRLKHRTSNHNVLIEKKDISFLDEEYKTIAFKTTKELYVGMYDVVFEFTDTTLQESFGEIIKSGKDEARVNVSNDPKYALKTYGIIALVRSTQNNKTDYDFYSFPDEGVYQQFYDGEYKAFGMLNNNGLKHDFGENVDATGEHEILVTVKGNLREMEKTVNSGNGVETKEKYWQAEFADGPIIINNILSYEGDKPLEIGRDILKGEYFIKGDGLLKVVNSINVWRSEWKIKAAKGIVYTLDESRISGHVPGGTGNKMRIELLGAGMMIQSIGGFLIDLKFGELSADWYDGGDGRVTYGIDFGGSASLPFAEAKNTDAEMNSGSTSDGTTPSTPSEDQGRTTTPTRDPGTSILTADQDDIGDAMNNLFNEDASSGGTTSPGTTPGSGNEGSESGSEGGSGGSGTESSESTSSGFATGGTAASGGASGGGSGTTTTTGSSTTVNPNKSKISKKNTGLTEGVISAAINNIKFGEKGELENGTVVVEDTGFVGIDTQVRFGMPKNLLGSFISNAPGLMVDLTINTIDNIYQVDFGVNVKIIECQVVLGLKQANIKGVDKTVPDRIEFHLRNGLAIPLGPGATPVFITGLGGGISNLADTIGGNFTSLPPITLIVSMRLQVIGMLVGDFSARLSLEELSIEGNFTIPPRESLFNIEAGLHARWASPWSIRLYGQINILEGIIKGGLTVTIADDYFYGYIYASLCIPDSIPLVGGKELAGIEAAASHEFIGANIKIIGIKFGVIYYWGKDVSFGKNIDLSAPTMMEFEHEDPSGETMMGYYGTNLHALKVNVKENDDSMRLQEDPEYRSIVAEIENAENQDSLLLEIPFKGMLNPKSEDIVLVAPNGKEIEMVYDDGNGNGNFIIQDRAEYGKYIYIAVTDDAAGGENLIRNGEWTIKCKTEGVELITVNANGVDDVPEIDTVKFTEDENDEFKLNARWDTIGEVKNNASLDIYLTKDKDVLEKMKTSDNSTADIGDSVLHIENIEEINSGKAEITIPEEYESGDYYLVAMLITMQGATCAISDDFFEFENPNLPASVESVEAIYGGNGNLYVRIKDAENIDYTHYLIEIEAEDKSMLKNNINQYAVGDDLIFIGKEAQLDPNKRYRVNVRTLREEKNTPNAGSEDGVQMQYFYGSHIESSDFIQVPEIQKPELLSVETTFDTSRKDISANEGTIRYTFDRPVWMELDVRGQKYYSDDKFKEIWEFELADLEDGDYAIDFKAYSLSKDYVTGADFETTVENAMIGFTVDTSAPALSLKQIESLSLEKGNVNTKFGTNVVTADENGEYTIEGLVEDGAKFTVDDSEEGITVERGHFVYRGTMSEDTRYIEHILKAVDKSENVTEMVVTVVNGAVSAFERIVLLIDGKEVQDNETYTMLSGEKATLAVYGETEDGKKIEIGLDEIDFNVLYSKNILTIADGMLYATSFGETAIKVTLATSSNSWLEDYVVITIEKNPKEDLLEALEEAESTLADGENKILEAKTELTRAIEEAKDIYNNQNVDSDDVKEAIEALKAATEKFENDNTKDLILSVIEDAEKVLNESENKTVDAKNALAEKINNAKSVYNNSAATKSDAEQTIKELEDAITAFEEANAKEELLASVANAETELAAGENKTVDEKALLQEEIDKARAVYNNPDATDSDVNNAKDALDEAVKLFKQNNTNDGLNDAIENAEKILSESENKTVDEKAELSAKIEDARAIYDKQDATNEEVTNAVTDLRKAVEAFEAPGIKNTLQSEILDAETSLNKNNKKTNEAKSEFRTAINEAKQVLENIDATNENVQNAIDALKSAKEAYENSPDKPESSGGTGARYYTVKAEESENGTVNVSHAKVIRGTSVTITAVPEKGYMLADLTVNGVSVGNKEVYTITSVRENTIVKALFEKIEEEKPDKAKWNPFDDVNENEWFHDVIKEAYEGDLMNGVTSTRFEPYTKVTRGMFVTMLYRMDGEKEAGDCAFEDVSENAYYKNAVAWAHENGIVKGVSDTKFAADNTITREQMAAILYRYAQYKNYDTGIGKDTNILSYHDAFDISGYAVEAMQWTIGEGIITGKSDGIIDPLGFATRAEAAAVLIRTMKAME